MNKNIIIKISTIVICSALMFALIYFNGCKQNNTENTATPSVSVEKVTNSDEKRDPVIVPSVSVVIEKKPKIDYTFGDSKSEGSTYHSSLGNLWTTDPGETISRTEPLKFQGHSLPSVNVSDAGIITGESSPDIASGQSGRFGIIDTIWTNIKKLAWIGALGGIGLIALYFLVPAAQPIISFIFRAIASIIPFIGSIVERIFAGLKWKKPLVETVTGIQKVKDYIQTRADLTQEQKDDINANINTILATVQDSTTQTTVKEIKLQKDL